MGAKLKKYEDCDSMISVILELIDFRNGDCVINGFNFDDIDFILNLHVQCDIYLISLYFTVKPNIPVFACEWNTWFLYIMHSTITVTAYS